MPRAQRLVGDLHTHAKQLGAYSAVAQTTPVELFKNVSKVRINF